MTRMVRFYTNMIMMVFLWNFEDAQNYRSDSRDASASKTMSQVCQNADFLQRQQIMATMSALGTGAGELFGWTWKCYFSFIWFIFSFLFATSISFVKGSQLKIFDWNFVSRGFMRLIRYWSNRELQTSSVRYTCNPPKVYNMNINF